MSDEWSKSLLTPKRKRSSYSSDVKLDVIRRKQQGERVVDIARVLGIPETSIYSILKMTRERQSKAEHTGQPTGVDITHHRIDAMEIMERRLIMWLEGPHPTSLAVAQIQRKALSLYKAVTAEVYEEGCKVKPFSASKLWFRGFLKRHRFGRERIEGNAAEVPPELQKTVKNESCPIKQVFNEHETDHDWKHRLSVTSLPITGKESNRYMLEEEENDGEDVVIVERKTLTIKGIKELFKKAEEMKNYVEQNDPLQNRAARFALQLNDALLPYKEVLLVKERSRRQTTLDAFFAKRLVSKERDAQPGPSGVQLCR